MLTKIEELLQEVDQLTAQNAEELEALRIKYLSKKGIINALMADFRNVPAEQKKQVGMKLNELKTRTQERIAALKETFENQDADMSGIDLTRTAYPIGLGTRHPLSIVKNEIIDIFARMGFNIADGPEVEDDLHVYTKLNFAADHPARDMQDTFFINVNPGDIIGYKYFGFGGLEQAQKGLKPFAGAKNYDKTYFNLFLTAQTDAAFKVNVWIDGPWDNEVWKGKKIGEITVPAGSNKGEVSKYTIDVTDAVKALDKKHAIYLVAESDAEGQVCTLQGLGFSADKKSLVYPAAPTVSIQADGQEIELPTIPVRSTNANGYTGYDQYEATYTLPAGTTAIPQFTASSNNPNVKIEITQPEAQDGKAIVKFDYNGMVKTYTVVMKN